MGLKEVIAAKATEELVKFATSKLGDLFTGKQVTEDVHQGQAWYEYLEPLGKKDHAGRPIYRVKKAFQYTCTLYGVTYRICVEEGFETDLASTPPWLWKIYPPNGSYALAAVLHDKMIRTQMYDYAICDRIFLHAMKYMPPTTPIRTRWIFYGAVRVFGSRYVYPHQSLESIEAARKLSGICDPERARLAGREPCKMADRCDAHRGFKSK